MNNALKKALINPWHGSLISFLPIVATRSCVHMLAGAHAFAGLTTLSSAGSIE
jgi:hypothetical protein